MSIDEMMATDEVKEVLDPGFRLYWGDAQMQDVVERAPEDRFTDSSLNAYPGSRATCIRSFVGGIRKIIRQGKQYGFDQAWIRARPFKDAPTPGKHEVLCDNGFRTTEVGFLATFGLSQAGQAAWQAQQADPARRAAIAEQVAQRKQAGKTVFLSLSSLLDSPEARTLLAEGERLHWGPAPPPAYTLRKGPDRYTEDASYKKYGRDGACHAAAMLALKEMLEDMRKGGYNAIIRVHSRLRGQPALDDEYECEMDNSEAEVHLHASFARLL